MVRWWSPALWGAHLLMLLVVGAAGGLGYWQYDVWHEHRVAEQRDLTNAVPVPIDQVLGHDAPLTGDAVGQPVDVRGTWLTAATVLVQDRRDDRGREGLWVVTPLTNGGADAPAIPIVRGWVPAGTRPSGVPAPPAATAEITGWLQPPESGGVPDSDPKDAVLPQLQTSSIAQRVHQDLYGGYVIAKHPDSGLEAATLSQLPSVGASTALRNVLYAFEWWFFAAFAIYLWVRHVREATAEPGPEDAEGEPVTEDHVASGS
ncbi:MAG TPA: SURF1 family protein [Nocardioides sp.]|nr:SURF1 family protein [Nocardioides sp.]